MDQTFNIPDSTDWLGTPLTTLAPLETSLRCQVCKDFFDNPVITSCCHTFCSLCIRRCLSVEGKCPTCRSGDQELKLRRNWALQEVVDSFKNARPRVLEFMKDAVAAAKAAEATVEEGGGAAIDELEQPATKRRRIAPPWNRGADMIPSSSGRTTRSQSRRVEEKYDEAYVVEDSQDEDFEPEPEPEPEPDDGLVSCPMCSRRMKNEAVFSHLDSCTGSAPQPKAQPPIRSATDSTQSSLQPPPTTKPPERLPKINYSLLRDNVLKKKLRELGIPDWGAKPLLQKRHTEWMNLWNANCDSRIPKPKRELLRELDVWERAQGGRAPAPAGSNASNSVMRKDFDSAAWSASHEDNFKKLIENAKMKKGPKIPAPSPKAESPSVSDETPSTDVGPSNPAEAPEPPPSEVLKEDHDVRHEIVDLTRKEEEDGVETISDSGFQTEGRAVALVQSTELDSV
ncbi:E3 ubiquitin-protein ligase rad18 [Arachnomyces sp. PD_36]|nr:E3 ubiquitin-protein ligase rad18 [Arachnomyces sp. PD_36]